MKTGTELIAEERQKQIDKYGFTGEHHANHPEWYQDNQLVLAAKWLQNTEIRSVWFPDNWDQEWFHRLTVKPYKERLIIAGALLAAEVDRLQAI